MLQGLQLIFAERTVCETWVDHCSRNTDTSDRIVVARSVFIEDGVHVGGYTIPLAEVPWQLRLYCPSSFLFFFPSLFPPFTTISFDMVYAILHFLGVWI